MSSPATPRNAATLGDEGFMSANDLRTYMTEMTMANVSQELQAMDRAEKARAELLKSLSEPVRLTPDFVAALTKRVSSSIRSAAQRGETEMMVMRFPNVLCSDKGRAINNSEEGWPDTLTGRPRQAFEFWRDNLRPQGYGLSAMIIEWPGGLPGDVGLFLNWKSAKA